MSAVNMIGFKKNDVIFSEGDTSDTMYIILSGKVLVFKNGYEKRKLHLAELGPGDILGEMSLISGFPRSASAIAVSEVKARIITKQIFSNSVSGIPSWALCIARVLIKRLRYMNSMVRNLSFEKIYKNRKSNLNLSGKFFVHYDKSGQPDVIFLKGYFFSSEISKVDEVLRKLIKTSKTIVLDFSNVIDIDSFVIKYLTDITTQMNNKGIEFSINNVQLIHEKISTYSGLNDTVQTIHPVRKHVMVNDLLITQGENDKNMYIIKQGRFEVFKTIGNKKVSLAQVGAGDVVGEMSFVAGNGRSASVKAVKPGVVYIINEQDLMNNKYNIPEWFLKIIHQLIQRLRHSNNTITGIFNIKNEKREYDNDKIFLYKDKSCMVRINGNFTLTDKNLFKKLVELLNNGFKDILLDFTGITKIDERSISSLNKIAASLKARDGKLRFYNAGYKIKEQLKTGSFFCTPQFTDTEGSLPLIDKSYNCINELIA